MLQPVLIMNAKYILAAALLAGSAATQAGIVFSDNFDAETPGLNRTPSNFTLVAGSVDVIGLGSGFDLVPGHGRYIDLDGSTRQGGTLRRNLSLDAGVVYTASFDLAGSHRPDFSNIVTVAFGSLLPVAYTRFSSDPFVTLQLFFTPLTTGTYGLSFTNSGGDNIGALLDNVLVTSSVGPSAAVSEPESVALMLTGLGIGGLVSRRRVQRA